MRSAIEIYVYFQIRKVLEHKDITVWLYEEVCGVVVQHSNLFSLFEKKFIKVIYIRKKLLEMNKLSTKYMFSKITIFNAGQQPAV